MLFSETQIFVIVWKKSVLIFFLRLKWKINNQSQKVTLYNNDVEYSKSLCLTLQWQPIKSPQYSIWKATYLKLLIVEIKFKLNTIKLCQRFLLLIFLVLPSKIGAAHKTQMKIVKWT